MVLLCSIIRIIPYTVYTALTKSVGNVDYTWIRRQSAFVLSFIFGF